MKQDDNPPSPAPPTAPFGRYFVRLLLAGSLTLLVGLGPMQPPPASADTIGDLKAKLGQGQQRLQELRSRQRTQQSLVENLRGVTGEYAVELSQVEQALLATVSRLRQAEADLAQLETDMQDLERRIAEKEAAVESRSGVYTTRLRALYKFSRTSPLEQLLGAADFSDALRRVTMMQAVARVDNRLLAQLRFECAELLQARQELQRKQEQAIALRDEIEAQRQALDQRRAEQAAVLARAQQQQGQAETALTLFDRQARLEQASIATLQVQYQRELEEMERQRQEALRRAEEARRQEQQRQAAAQATATAQARAQATAQARAQVQATSAPGAAPARSASSAGTSGASASSASTARSTPVPVAGSVATGGLAPSADGFIWPIANPVVTTEFGERSPGQRFHTGIDLAQTIYTPVRAAADGIVIESGLAVAGNPSQSYGMRVSLAHPKGLATLYAHLDDERRKPTVKAGDRVKRGDVIGYIGMTGITTGPHLHFEILVSGTAKNPRLYLPT